MTYQEFAQRWFSIHARSPMSWKPRKNMVCVLDYDNFEIKDPNYGFSPSMFRLMAELLETPEDERGN